jgi:hypothetical protein
MSDRDDVADIIGSLAVHVDGRQWGRLQALFAAEVRVDYTSLFGGDAQSLTREDLIAGWRKLLPGFTRTCHVIGAPAIVAIGSIAQATASVVAWHFLKEASVEPDFWLVGGCYEMSFAKADGVWRITLLTLANAWAEGNLDLPKLAGERASLAGF